MSGKRWAHRRSADFLETVLKQKDRMVMLKKSLFVCVGEYYCSQQEAETVVRQV